MSQEVYFVLERVFYVKGETKFIKMETKTTEQMIISYNLIQIHGQTTCNTGFLDKIEGVEFVKYNNYSPMDEIVQNRRQMKADIEESLSEPFKQVLYGVYYRGVSK